MKNLKITEKKFYEFILVIVAILLIIAGLYVAIKVIKAIMLLLIEFFFTIGIFACT